MPLPVLQHNIPGELKHLDQWVVWRLQSRPGNPKPTKVPYQAKPGNSWYKAASTNPETWTAFDQATRCYDAHRRTPERLGRDHEAEEASFYLDGIGFVLTDADPFVAWDFDHCRDAESGEINPDVLAMVKTLSSYMEVSPSGTGLRVIVKGKLPRSAKKGDFEAYQSERFVTLTGQVVEGNDLTITTPQASMDALFERLFGAEEKTNAPRRTKATVTKQGFEPDDAAVVDKCRSDKRGATFKKLFDQGDFSDYPSKSEARMAAVGHLSFYAGPNAEQIDRVYREGELMDEKWDSRRGASTYGGNTIAEVLKGRTEFYDWSHDAKRGRPRLPLTGDFDAALETCAVNLAEANNPEPKFYLYGDRLAKYRPLPEPKIHVLTVNNFREEVAAHMEVGVEKTKSVNGEELVVFDPCEPPASLLSTLAESERLGRFPRLSRLSGVPIVTASGKLQKAYGYDPETETFMYSREVERILPEGRITKAQVQEAIAWYREGPFHGFPFATPADETHTFAAVLQHYVRDMIDAETPLFYVQAPNAGTGKSKLARLICEINSPDIKETYLPNAKEEVRKTLMALIGSGTSHILLDNVRGKVESGELDQALTSDKYSGRILGVTGIGTYPNRATWLMTSNNAELGGDLPSRCVLISLDAKTATPWKRQHRIKNLKAWTAKNRLLCVKNALVLVQYWLQEGMPPYKGAGYHRAEGWVAVVGGICECAGLPGFLGNLEELEEGIDEADALGCRFVESWFAAKPPKPGKAETEKVPATGLVEFAYGVTPDRWDDDEPVLGPLWTTDIERLSGQARAMALGHWLKANRGRTFNGLRVVVWTPKSKTQPNQYKIEVTPDREAILADQDEEDQD